MQNQNKAKIKEIFESIQGEGLYVGCKQIFVRFCACNLHCNYCDTDFYPENIENKSTYFEFSPNELINHLKTNFDLNTVHSISLTGGEPLIWADFLQEFIMAVKKELKLPIYLETNGTIADNAIKVLPDIDILSADIKLPSCSGIENSFELHDKFFDSVSEINKNKDKQFSIENKNYYAKVVFDQNITDEEIIKTVELAKKYGFYIILQPKMIGDEFSVNSEFMTDVFDKFLKQYKPTRLIPQVHKYMKIE